MQHSIEKSDDAWENVEKTLRTNENRLIRRNVPRFIVFSDNGKLF